MSTKPSEIDELVFEPRDIEVFKIPDTKTKIATVQNYFFPRLEFLVRHTLNLVQSVYDVNPYERMSFVYHPSNRKNARVSFDFHEAYVGIAGKRRTDRPLTVKHGDGKPFFFHPTNLTYNVRPEGTVHVQLLPFRTAVDERFIESFSKLVRQNVRNLTPILAREHVSYSSAQGFIPFDDIFVFTSEYRTWDFALFSPSFYFPVNVERGLAQLIWAFVALFPLLDASVSIGEGEPTRLPEMLEKYKKWWLSFKNTDEEPKDDATEPKVLQIPELDSYSFVRAGLWWSVLARDNWTCRSCGRTPKDGVSLEVDHITPRSRGGTNVMDNLQTLCKKCNIGKSNRDSTDLR